MHCALWMQHCGPGPGPAVNDGRGWPCVGDASLLDASRGRGRVENARQGSAVGGSCWLLAVCGRWCATAIRLHGAADTTSSSNSICTLGSLSYVTGGCRVRLAAAGKVNGRESRWSRVMLVARPPLLFSLSTLGTAALVQLPITIEQQKCLLALACR